VVEAFFNGDAPKRIIINAPPRHGKSEYVSHRLPVWALELFPTWPVLLTSYEATFAGKWGGRVRDTIEAHPDELRIRVRQDISAKHQWELAPFCVDQARTRAGGGMNTAGAGGPITGHGAMLAVIDDPHKNLQEALSRTMLDGIWDWYRGTLRDRLDPGAIVLLAMQRWIEDDLTGRLIEQARGEGETWTVITLPAEAQENDPLGRAVGEPLCPERFDVKALATIHGVQGDWLYAAKFQQQPKSAQGKLFKRSTFRYFRDADEFYELLMPSGVKRVSKSECFVFQTCDPAATEHDQSDYFVLQTWIYCPEGELLLYDQLREKAETVKHEKIMLAAYLRYKPALMRVEEKTFGLNIIQKCARGEPREGLPALPVKPVKVDNSKLARAIPLEAKYTNGLIYHREGAPWLAEFEDELLAFDRGTHDDQVDAASQAVLPFTDAPPAKPSDIAAVGPQRETTRIDY
jgi:predicted phage terminase large subunit-like protein